ncbi:MAG: Uma2 family endonuclease [Acidobacteriota bacterium]
MAAQSQPYLTPEQYLQIERAAEFRSEYYDGVMYAMSGGTHVHALIIGNLCRELGNALKNRPCLVTVSDLRVRAARKGLYTYPDITVVCDEPRYVDGESDTLLNPALLIEVLSPSTESHDRGFKAGQYRRIPDLKEYALVSQKVPQIELYRRQPDGKWLLSEAIGLESTCYFDSVECSIPMAEIYAKVTLPGETPLPRPTVPPPLES